MEGVSFLVAGSSEAACNIMSGPVSTNFRAAIILTRFPEAKGYFFALYSKLQETDSRIKGIADIPELCFPSQNIEIGCTGRDTAFKAVDCWLGPAFRRGGQLPDEQLEPFHLCPVTSRAMQRTEQNLTFVGS
eukprot:7311882-Prymnesium_polylepis.1